jgi:hypothetical protein
MMGARKARFAGVEQDDALEQGPLQADGVVPIQADRVWSREQQAILKEFETGTRPLVIRARAGTGKTTMIEAGVQVMPEPTVFITSFGRKITNELQRRCVRDGVDALGLHQVGRRAVVDEWPGLNVADPRWKRAAQLTDAVVPAATPKPIRKLISDLNEHARDLCGLDYSAGALYRLRDIEDYAPDDGWSRYDLDFVVRHAALACHHAATVPPSPATGIDFADMMFLPLAWNLLPPRYAAGIVDETQDLSMAQLAIIQRLVSGRIILVGDDRQAIFAFRGADCGALDRLKAELGAAELPLTTTYRCCQYVVRKVKQTLVPDLVAHLGNPEGVVDTADFWDHLLPQVKPGDFVLSRLNAPLVRTTLMLIQNRVRARMAGRELGVNVKKLLTKLKCFGSEPISVVLDRLAQWESKQVALALSHSDRDRAERVQDEAEMLRELSREADTAAALSSLCGWLFVAEDDPSASYVLCSSIHKAKGLEAERVWVLQESLYRRGQSQEEDNLCYVAWTRAKQHLTLVSGVPGLEAR